MADSFALLVPIHIDALLVNAQVASNVPFERFANSWGNLSKFNNPVPAPWGSDTSIQPGVHLHWQLPSALTHGKSSDGSSTATFPYTPNRWLVVRLASQVQGTAAQTMSAWLIESDFTDPNEGTTPFVTTDSTATNIQTTLLGRHMPVAQWTGEPAPDGSLFLTSTGIAQTSFLAYQPGLLDVYSFFDDTTSLPENTMLTYLVMGWYSNAAHDPLILWPTFDPDTATFADLEWQVLGLDNGAVPTRSVFHGLVNDLQWQTASVPPRVDSDASSMQVALGYTSIDALSAILAQDETASAPSPEQIEMMLSAFQYDALALLDEPDATAQLELRVRQAWFGATPGGTLWSIVPVGQGQSSADPLSPAVQKSHPPLTPQQQQWLANLNAQQNQLDVQTRELRTLQWELFALWWKLQFAAHNLMQPNPGLTQWGININALTGQLANQLDSSQANTLYSTVAALQKQLSDAQTQLPIATSPTSIDQFSQKMPGYDGTLILKPNALPPFYQPADPVLLVAGVTPPTASSSDSQTLPCRYYNAGADAVNVVVNGQTTSVSGGTGDLANFIQQPGQLLASGGLLQSLLDDPVATALVTLATEAFFADPNNATSIVFNALGSSDPTVIAALQTAMANATAQTGSIPNPLQASFAFALWQQAWSPLFLEWNLQFYPTVQPTFTGQQLPPQSLLSTGAKPVQDNLLMDLADWSFNGGSGVFQRGSEYYTWAGGDIWNQNPWLVPQAFVGRSSLTPNSQTLFLARLSAFIASQPQASATAVVTNGAVTAVNLTNAGSGYSEAPVIAFSGSPGSGAAATAVVADGVLIGINVTSGGSGYTTPPQVNIGPGDWSAIQSLIDAIGETRFLSQTLSGFNDNFVMKQAMHVLPPDPATAGVIDGQNRAVPNPTLGNVPIKFGQGQPFFFPVRGGFFAFTQLQIVDSFGQVLDLLQANGNNSGLPSTFKPILGAGLTPDSSIASSTYQIKQAPRLIQPSRLNLSWLDSFDDSTEVYLQPGSTPVCGWLIPNHLDHSIAVYNADGTPLGELLVLMQSTGSQAVTWLPAPGSPTSVNDPSQIKNPHLSAAICAFTQQGGGIPAAERVNAFQAWFNSIDETLWTVDPPGGQTDANLAVLIGRPLALTRMQVSFELYGRPAYNQSWRDTFDLSNPSDQSSIEVGQQEAGFTSMNFPIQLGSTELLQDGVIGYFLNDTYTAFNAVHAASSPQSSYIQPVGGSNVISLPFNYPNYSAQVMSLLIDPLGTIDATTGTLPVAQANLSSEFYAAALATMAVSFRIGPILTDPETICIPVPSEQHGDWSWVWQTAPGTFESEGVVAATGQANLPKAPPHMMEGWLVLTPSDKSKS